MYRKAIIKTLLLAMISVTGILAGPCTKAAWAQVLVVGPDNDPRIEATREAVAFWNRTLSELGLSFRLGAVSHSSKTIPADYLRTLSAQVLGGGRSGPFSADVQALPGNIVVALSDGDFVSFTARGQSKTLIGIRSNRLYPLTLPNVPRNVIAHELGHAIGLRHNSDPAMLMCGRPAPCRPDAFKSATSRFFPLTDSDKAQLTRMYR